METVSDFHVLTSSHSWRATPWDYNSVRGLIFRADGGGDLMYGYGQTIYAHVKCRFEVLTGGLLRLSYLASPAFQRFPGFVPAEGNTSKEVRYTLTAGVVMGVEDVIAKPYKFLWTLELSSSPYPLWLTLPYGVPLVFYGHEERQGQNNDPPER